MPSAEEIERNFSLTGECSGNSIEGSFKYGVEAIPGGFHNPPSVRFYGIANHLVMAGRSLLHLVGVIFPKRGAVFEICKQEGQGMVGHFQQCVSFLIPEELGSTDHNIDDYLFTLPFQFQLALFRDV